MGETLSGRILAALRSEGRLSESVGAGCLDRNWPPALKDSGAGPLKSLRKSFFDGSLTRLLDPDAVLRAKIPEFVQRGDFGLASGATPDGAYQRVWFEEPLPPPSRPAPPTLEQQARALAQVAAGKPAGPGQNGLDDGWDGTADGADQKVRHERGLRGES